MSNAEPGSSGSVRSKSGRFTKAIPFSRPIVKKILSKLTLSFDTLHLAAPTASGFEAELTLRIDHLATGGIPLNARVSFEEPASLCWPLNADGSGGEEIAQLLIEPLTLGGDASSARLAHVKAVLRVDPSSATQQVQLARLVRAVLQTPTDPARGVTVDIASSKVKVKALGMTFTDLKLRKSSTLTGLSGLGGVLTLKGSELEAPPAAAQGSTARTGKGSSKTKRPLSAIFSRSSSRSDSSSIRLSRRSSSYLSSLRSIPSNEPSDSSEATAVFQQSPDQGKAGAQSLTISDLEIVGANPVDGILIEAKANIFNPTTDASSRNLFRLVKKSASVPSARLTAEIGDLTFALAVPTGSGKQPAGAEAIIGTLQLANVQLGPGQNTIYAKGKIQLSGGPSTDAALALIARILQNEPSQVAAVAGDQPISNIPWLAKVFEGARMDAVLPALGERGRLLRDVSLGSALPGGAQVSGPNALLAKTLLANPFATPVQLTSLQVTVTYEDAVSQQEKRAEVKSGSSLLVASIDLGSSWAGCTLPASQTVSETFPTALNEDKSELVDLLRVAARQEGIALGLNLEQVLDLIPGSRSRPPSVQVDAPTDLNGIARRPRTNSSPMILAELASDVPDLPTLLVRALAHLKVTAHVVAGVKIGEYVLPEPIRFSQPNVPVAFTQEVAESILPDIGEPIVARLLDQAELEVSSIEVKSIDEEGIGALVEISLSNFGPISARVQFNQGLVVADPDTSDALAVLYFEEDLVIEATDQKPVKL